MKIKMNDKNINVQVYAGSAEETKIPKTQSEIVTNRSNEDKTLE